MFKNYCLYNHEFLYHNYNLLFIKNEFIIVFEKESFQIKEFKLYIVDL